MTAQELRDEWQVNVTDTLTELLLKVIRFAFGLIHARLRRLEQDNPPPYVHHSTNRLLSP
jgi:hypothetical protein